MVAVVAVLVDAGCAGGLSVVDALVARGRLTVAGADDVLKKPAGETDTELAIFLSVANVLERTSLPSPASDGLVEWSLKKTPEQDAQLC